MHILSRHKMAPNSEVWQLHIISNSHSYNHIYIVYPQFFWLNHIRWGLGFPRWDFVEEVLVCYLCLSEISQWRILIRHLHSKCLTRMFGICVPGAQFLSVFMCLCSTYVALTRVSEAQTVNAIYGVDALCSTPCIYPVLRVCTCAILSSSASPASKI